MLTNKQKIAVAKDVIKQIEEKVYRAITNAHLIQSNIPTKFIGDLQGYCKSMKRCTGCARGTMFISTVKLFNKYKLVNTSHIEIDDDLRAKTEKDWGKDQIRLIENAFMTDYYNSRFASAKAVKMGRLYDNNNERLIAIMENIISNNGTFKP